MASRIVGAARGPRGGPLPRPESPPFGAAGLAAAAEPLR